MRTANLAVRACQSHYFTPVSVSRRLNRRCAPYSKANTSVCKSLTDFLDSIVKPPSNQTTQSLARVEAVVIVDHGSKKAESNAMLVEFGELFASVTRRKIVEIAHMEIAEPSILEAVSACVSQGATHVVVAPYFLSRGRHVQRDIPALVEAAREQFPTIKIELADAIGVDALLAKLIDNRVKCAAARFN